MRRYATRLDESQGGLLHPEGELRIATYNVHGCVGNDGVRDVDRVAQVITTLRADIVGLQEVDCRQRLDNGATQLDRLAERTGMTAVSGPTIVENGGFFGNALLTRFAVADVERVDLSVAGREPRGLLEVVLGHGRPRLRVIVTHFGLRAAERRVQVDALLARVADPRPVVLLGDFNEWHSRAAALMRLHAALGQAPRVKSFPARWPLLALDRIWVRPLASLDAISCDDSLLARWASDHLPVVAEIDRARLFGLSDLERRPA